MLGLVSLTAATHTESFESSGSASGLDLPEIDSQAEMLTKLVAPFLLITLVLDAGVRQALKLVIMPGEEEMLRMGRNEKQNKRATIRKYSLVISLAAAGMSVPTQMFTFISDWVGVLFSGAVFLFLVFLVGMFFWKVVI